MTQGPAPVKDTVGGETPVVAVEGPTVQTVRAVAGAVVVKLMVCGCWRSTVTSCICVMAALKLVSPAWLASMTQVPAPVKETVAWDTSSARVEVPMVQTVVGLVVLKVTSRSDGVVAVTV